MQLDVVTVRGPDGRPRWRIATVQDITWRRRAAAELAAQQARLAAIIDSAMDAIISIDDQQRIVMANPAAEEMFRHVNGSLAGRHLDELLPQRLRHAHRGHVQQFTARGTTRRRMAAFQSLLGLRADGSEFPIEASISLVPVADGNLMTAVVRDVSLQRQLERDILEISESERRRFSGELHDGLGSVLTGLRFMCDAALRDIGESPTPLRDDLEKIGSGLREVITNVRRIARGLAPLELERDGLEPALRELASHYATFFGIPCHAHIDARAAARLRTEEAAHLYRIAQEGVANAAKHARASSIDLGLVADGPEVVLTIADDGRGPSGRSGKESSGLGLQSMEYRARLLAGAFSVAPRQPRGTLVSCRIRAA